jgi:FkbM family methyltransferase
MPATDEVMRPFIQARGTWEADEGRLLRGLFRPGLRFLDVGANVGYFSLLVAKHCPGAVIHAFEPHPFTSHVLGLNVWESRADITVHALALSGGERTVVLSSSPTNLGDTRVTSAETATMLAPAAPLDEVLPDAVFDVVKIDVQGFEAEVIAGMAGAIERSRSMVIVAEFWPTALRERGMDPVQILNAYRDLGLSHRVQVASRLLDLPAAETVRTCDNAGANGQVNLVLSRA